MNPEYQLSDAWNGVWMVIPAFNEAGTIRGLAESALAQCPRVIVVDDGSTDGTAEQLQGLAVTLLIHSRNHGKGQCLRTAFDHAIRHNAQCVISIDGDGQHDPADAPKLLAVWRHQPDNIVIGSRLHDRAQFPPVRYYANCVAHFWVSWAAGYPIVDTQSGFRVYPRDVVNLSISGRVSTSRFTFESEILIEAGHIGRSTVEVAIPGRYFPTMRPSHFRAVVDVCKITLMVAARLLRQGMAPRGLVRSLKPVRVLTEQDVATLTRRACEPYYESQDTRL